MALSGKQGYMTIGSCTMVALTDWDLTYGSPNEEYFAVSGNGASETVGTAERGSGTMNMVVDADALAADLAETGDLVTLTLLGQTGLTLATGSARLGQFNFSGNREGTVQRASVPFMTDGTWTGAGLRT